MALTTIGAVWDRISALVEQQKYRRAVCAFDFDQQPDGNLERTYCLRSERISTAGYIGGDQAEQHRVEIFLALRVKKNEWGAARQLKVDMDTIEASIASGEEALNYDYGPTDDAVESEVQPPGADQDFVVGRLALIIELDRMMSE